LDPVFFPAGFYRFTGGNRMLAGLFSLRDGDREGPDQWGGIRPPPTPQAGGVPGYPPSPKQDLAGFPPLWSLSFFLRRNSSRINTGENRILYPPSPLNEIVYAILI